MMINNDYTRELGWFELMHLSGSQKSTFNIVIVAKIIGDLKPTELREALYIIQQRNHVLGVRVQEIAGKLYFTNKEVPIIPLEIIIKKDDKKEWETIRTNELNTNFDIKCGPLARVKYLIGSSANEIILTCHHAISDGVSAIYFFKELLDIAFNLQSGNNIESLMYPQRLPVEEIIPEFEFNIQNTETALTEKHSNQPHSRYISSAAILETHEHKIYAKDILLSEEQTSILIRQCKYNGVTVQSFMCANLMLALYKVLAHSTNQNDLPINMVCNTLVNIRPYLGISCNGSLSKTPRLAISDLIWPK